jgi:pimeloyl-ACP methyl ester carboxylesterase
MRLDTKIRQIEERLYETAGLDPDISFVELATTGTRVRVLAFGSGPPVVLLHGVAFCAASWTPLLGHLTGYRVHAVDLPGHGLSDPTTYRRGAVRAHALQLIDDVYDALGLTQAPLVGHSLGGMFALWHAAARPGRISSLVAVGDPAVAIPGATVRMPLSILTVPVVGRIILGSRSPRFMFRRLVRMGLGPAATAAASRDLLDVLRLAGRRRGNARTVAALLHAIDGFRRPRPESVMDADELGRVTVPTLFLWGTDDTYMSPDLARPWIEKMPAATLHEVPAGHAPWFEDPTGSAAVIARHLAGH